MYSVTAYYKFASVKDPEGLCSDHKKKCLELNLKGRVYIADEGINGTLSGEIKKIDEYKKYLSNTPGFQNTEFKDEDCVYIPFPDLRIKTRPEIVTLKADVPIDIPKDTAAFLSPRQWCDILESKKEYTMIDVRNEHETKIGHFEGAVLPDADNFYDFPKWLDRSGIDKKKKILMYCTGGIRCEKFSAFMKKKGYEDIYQLKGGILNYAKELKGTKYRGKCFVFDDRISVNVDHSHTAPISRCEISGIPCDTYINCANMDCNKLFICSKEAAIEMKGCCSEKCKGAANRRPFDPEKIYLPFRRWYKYFDDKKMIRKEDETLN